MAKENEPVNPLDSLYEIVNDLWGRIGTQAATLNSTTGSVSPEALAAQAESIKSVLPEKTARPARPVWKVSGTGLPTEAGAAVSAAPQAAESKPAESKPEKAEPAGEPAAGESPQEPQENRIPFETFWRQADESVDWTDVLLQPEPQDKGEDAVRWIYLHSRAPRVLSGDLDAYREVLQFADPMSDLIPWTKRVTVSADSPDHAKVNFSPLPDHEDDPRALAALCLRCARDVLALLPVREVTVTARNGNKTLLRVNYPRERLRRVRFGFIDPLELARELGADC